VRGILGRRYSGPIEGRKTYTFPGHCLRCCRYQEARELAGSGRFRLRWCTARRTDQLSPNPHSRFENQTSKIQALRRRSRSPSPIYDKYFREAKPIAIMASTQSVQCFGKKKTGKSKCSKLQPSTETNESMNSYRCRPLQGTNAKTSR
jgi:hypothetical protein